MTGINYNTCVFKGSVNLNHKIYIWLFSTCPLWYLVIQTVLISCAKFLMYLLLKPVPKSQCNRGEVCSVCAAQSTEKLHLKTSTVACPSSVLWIILQTLKVVPMKTDDSKIIFFRVLAHKTKITSSK